MVVAALVSRTVVGMESLIAGSSVTELKGVRVEAVLGVFVRSVEIIRLIQMKRATGLLEQVRAVSPVTLTAPVHSVAME